MEENRKTQKQPKHLTQRIFAYLIDLMLVFFVVEILCAMLGIQRTELPIADQLKMDITSNVVFVLYSFLFTAVFTKGQTVGKILMHLRVVSNGSESLPFKSELLFREVVGKLFVERINLWISLIMVSTGLQDKLFAAINNGFINTTPLLSDDTSLADACFFLHGCKPGGSPLPARPSGQHLGGDTCKIWKKWSYRPLKLKEEAPKMKKNLLKTIAVGLSGVILSGMLAACAPSNPSPSGTQGGTPTDEKPDSITLNYAYWDFIPNQEEIFANFAKEYKEETGIDVKVEGVMVTDANWQDTFKTQVAAGSGPDVFHLDANWLSSWADTVIQPIDGYFEEDFWDQFTDSAEDMWIKDGKHYAVSNSFSVISVLYNEKMIEESGAKVPGPTETWTLEEFEAAMETIYNYYKDKTVTYTDGKEYPYYVIGTNSTMYYFWLMFGAMGGTPMAETNNIAQNAYADAIVKIAEWVDKGWVTPSADVQPGGTTVAFSSAANVAFNLTGDWTATSFYRQHHGIGGEQIPVTVSYSSCPTPVGQDGKVVSEMYNQGVVMNKNLTGWKAHAAAALIRHMTTTDAWLAARGPEAGGLGLPARKEWSEQYATEWFEKPEERAAFIWTAENGRICSPDYNAGGIDLVTKLTEVIKALTTEAQKEGTLDLAAAREMAVSMLEEQQALLNLELTENGIELDNPDGKIK